MSSNHLSCRDCHIRVRANAPEIGVLEGRCPICGVTLRASPAAGVLGFRCFDLDVLADPESHDRAGSPGDPSDFVARPNAGSPRDDAVEHGWPDDAVGLASVAVARWVPR
jgi:hypothetical protein